MKSASHTPSSSQGRNGFTLLELLVSSVILACIITLLIGMADGSSKIWRDGERRREGSREARAGLEMITEDLHSAIIVSNRATLSIVKESGDREGSRIFFLVSHTDEKRSTNGEGDLCATGYFVAQDPVKSGGMNLYRFHASGETVARAFEKNRLEELYTSANPENRATTELLARHIVQLDILPVKNESSEMLIIRIYALAGEGSHFNDPKATVTSAIKERNERLLRQHLQRYSTIVRLPPTRTLPSGS
ncbi:MAG: prepilin-type N-terminal cleavage/methylation domain-containing protein [bacterium]